MGKKNAFYVNFVKKKKNLRTYHFMVLLGKLREKDSLEISFMIINEDDVAWFGSL